jgi:hypothetical protein
VTARQSVAARPAGTPASAAAPTSSRRSVSRWTSAGVLRALRDGALILGLALAAARALGLVWPVGYDAHAYWIADVGQLYPAAGAAWGQQDFFGYSPAFAQALEPFRALAFPVFLGVWTALMVLALVFLAGPLTLVVVLFYPVWLELVVANVNLFIGVAVVIGFRWPAAWALILLTKVTPGIGLLWFAVRREWRALAIALGATAAIVVASFAFAPAAWLDWLRVLATAPPPHEAPVQVPLIVRLPIAALIVVWAARGNHRWALPVAVLLAMPAMWDSTFSILVAVLPLIDRRELGRQLLTVRELASRRVRLATERPQSPG